MKIFVDADSCPKAARELVVRAANKRRIEAVFAANRLIPGIGGGFALMEVCSADAGAADDFIAVRAQPGDLAVTRDVPLAARLVERGVAVIDDRGGTYTADNIAQKLSMRDFTVALAENGLDIARSPQYGKKELKVFADAFDRALARLARGG